MSEWKPIETAPKNGTPVLLWFVDGGADVCWRDGDRWTDGEYRWADDAFSHWMPLPEPPQ